MAVFARKNGTAQDLPLRSIRRFALNRCSLADSGSFVSITEPQLCLSRKGESIEPTYGLRLVRVWRETFGLLRGLAALIA
jgi:hypothetical protein